MNLHNAVFSRSVATPAQFPRDGLPQVAFAGRSNVGKSSVINRLLLRKNFARVGQLPGKTVCINYFCIDELAYFVDLPGYGYAKVSQAEKDRWAGLLDRYFAEGHVDLGVLIVDARHTPTVQYRVMADWFLSAGCPFVVVANKLDKVKKSEAAASLARVGRELALPASCEVLPFSAETGQGRTELLAKIMDKLVRRDRQTALAGGKDEPWCPEDV